MTSFPFPQSLPDRHRLPARAPGGMSACTAPARSTASACAALAVLLAAAPLALADHPTVGVAGVGAGPINTANATTLPKGLFALTLGAEYVNADRYSDAELESFGAQDIEAHSTDKEIVPYVGAAYGVTDDFMVGARLPWLLVDDIREPAPGGGVDDEGDVNGLGDATLFTQYRFVNDVPSQFEMAVIAGMKVPTGSDREHSDAGELFETEHQPGSGSWDPLLGLVATQRFGRSTVSAQLMYTKADNGNQDTNLGDVIGYNLGWSYHVGGPDPLAVKEGAAPHVHQHADGTTHVHDDGAPVAHHEEDMGYDLVLELNGIRREELTVSGDRDENTGGNRLYLSPGVRVPMSERSSFFASVGLPLFEHLNGSEHETDYRTVLGWSFAY